MEYVDGRSLDTILRASGPLDPERSVAVITQVLSALGFAHQNGIVHRDVKPSNIMVLNSGEVKVADFGIARIDASEFTIVGDLLGTPAYMAPEQFAGAPVDKRTDLFAAGVIFFEMLTGVKPFRGKSITEIISFMETRGPEDIRALNPAVPDSLKRVISKALAFDPALRYADAAEFSTAIIEAFPARSEQAPRPEPSVSDTPVANAELGKVTPGDKAWHPELLRQIERDLATFIGPMAAIALKRAIKETNDIIALYDLLAQQVENPRDHAEFLARGQRRAALGPAAHRPHSKRQTEAEPKTDRPTTSPGLANIASVEVEPRALYRPDRQDPDQERTRKIRDGGKILPRPCGPHPGRTRPRDVSEGPGRPLRKRRGDEGEPYDRWGAQLHRCLASGDCGRRGSLVRRGCRGRGSGCRGELRDRSRNPIHAASPRYGSRTDRRCRWPADPQCRPQISDKVRSADLGLGQ